MAYTVMVQRREARTAAGSYGLYSYGAEEGSPHSGVSATAEYAQRLHAKAEHDWYMRVYTHVYTHVYAHVCVGRHSSVPHSTTLLSMAHTCSNHTSRQHWRHVD